MVKKGRKDGEGRIATEEGGIVKGESWRKKG
jgi:hypothetical protein